MDTNTESVQRRRVTCKLMSITDVERGFRLGQVGQIYSGDVLCPQNLTQVSECLVWHLSQLAQYSFPVSSTTSFFMLKASSGTTILVAGEFDQI